MGYKILSDHKDSINVPRPPRRIVSLTPSASEVICALGGMDTIVGRDDHSKYPPGLDEKPSLGSCIYKTINIERLRDTNPDVVFTSKYIPAETLERIESAGIPVVIIGVDCEVATLMSNVRTLGEIMNAEKKAEELIEFMERYVNLVRERTLDLDVEFKPLVYHECAFKKYNTTAARTPADDCITLAGGVNIAHDEAPGNLAVSGEWVAQENPDIIITQVSSTPPLTEEALKEKADEILSRPELKETTAVKSGKIYVNHLFLRRGPQLIGYILYLSKWFHPELFEDIDPASVEREVLLKFYGVSLEGTWVHP